MPFDHLNDTIPTLTSEGPQRSNYPTPNKPLLNAIADRIKAQAELWYELEQIFETLDKKRHREQIKAQAELEYSLEQILATLDEKQKKERKELFESENVPPPPLFIDQLSAVIGQGLIDINENCNISRNKINAHAYARTTMARLKALPHVKRTRAKELRICTKIVRRKMTAREQAHFLASRISRYEKNQFRRLLVRLYHLISGGTDRPYTYIAAIAGLFYLHPRAFCKGCSYFPVPRKDNRQLKGQSLTEKIRRSQRLCQIENILRCPRRETGRQTVRHTIQAAPNGG